MLKKLLSGHTGLGDNIVIKRLIISHMNAVQNFKYFIRNKNYDYIVIHSFKLNYEGEIKIIC